MKTNKKQRTKQSSAIAFFIIYFSLFIGGINAQHSSCGIQHELEKYQQSNPKDYAKRLKKYNAFIQDNVKKVKSLKSANNADLCPNGITVLPIAFQVFHNGEAIGSGNNFSREDLTLVVDQLNADFSGYSYLKNQITGEFESFESGHTCIQFAIGKINRINQSACPYWSEGAIHSDLHNCLPGGSGVGSANDPNDYLNIYITDLKNGYLGIASSIPPLYGRANSDDDGVTINQDIVIPGRNVSSLYNRGSVLAHEIGHWLGLPHVNGDINGSGCGADDGFTDTYPQSAQRFYYCNNDIPQSCGSVDNIFNFMDYSADCAKLMFTEEQTMTMQKILETERSKLSTSFARGNEDRQAYNTTCKSFEANSSLFEFVVVDCHTELNFLEYQTKWYPSVYNKNNPSTGLSLYTWQQENRGETPQAIQKRDLYKKAISHQSTGYTDVNTFNLYVQCWDPYKKAYSEKQPAGRLMVIVKRCPAPDNDEMAEATEIGFGTDCYSEDYILNNASPSPQAEISCAGNEDKNDVWFTTKVPEQVGMTVELMRLDRNIANPVMEVYVSRNGTLECVSVEAKSFVELVDLVPGEDLYFRVFNENDADFGAFNICLAQSSLNNNTCLTAAKLTTSEVCEQKIYHNYGATASGYPSNKAICGRTDKALDIWFEVEVPASGDLFVESFYVEDGVSEIIMEAYAGSCDNLVPVACSSIKEYWPVYDRHALVELQNRTPGEVIYIRIFGAGPVQEGEFGLCAYGGAPQTSCRINFLEALDQSECQGADNTYEQDIRVHYRNAGDNEYIYVNNQAFRATGSPQVITLKGLNADNKLVNVSANIGNSKDDLCWQQSFYKAYSLFQAPGSCLSELLANDDCVGAIELNVGNSCNQEIYSNLGATHTPGISSYFSCGVSGYKPNDVWFKVKVKSSGNVVVSAPLLFNENNMILEAFEGPCDNLRLVDCDQFGGSKGSEIKLANRTPGEYIYIRVADQGNNTQGDFAMCSYEPAMISGFVSAQFEEEEEKAWYFDEETETIVQLNKDFEQKTVDISVHPNPAVDYLNIEMNFEEDETKVLTITDVMGRTIERTEYIGYGSDKIKVDVSNIPSGQYFLTVSSHDQRITKRIVISNR